MNGVLAPMHGKVLEILVEVGGAVAEEQPVVLIEAMKMEMPVFAEAPGTVAEIRVQVGQVVAAYEMLVVFSS